MRPMNKSEKKEKLDNVGSGQVRKVIEGREIGKERKKNKHNGRRKRRGEGKQRKRKGRKIEKGGRK